VETYYESAEGERITFRRVGQEFRNHGHEYFIPADFFTTVEPGPDGLYDAQEVLRYLGY
jgi:hypothetical protein